ncbi:MAG: lysozyme [Alphaproteobacteria bacterium]|nr:lysozyme [Alphaproteobacteria bacterium]
MAVAWPQQGAVIALAAPLIRQFEGFRSAPYICPAGKPTIGYGTTRYPDGTPVALTDKPCTPAQAEEWLEWSARRLMAALAASGAVTRPPTLHQAAALVCLAYNIGVGCHDGVKGDLADSMLLEKFNTGDIAAAADQFLVWDKAHVNGVLVAVPGLLARRRAEQALFLQADAS